MIEHIQPEMVREEQQQSNTDREIENIMKKISIEHNEGQLCLTGPAFNHLIPDNVETLSSNQLSLMVNTKVFARSKPNDKVKVVSTFQKMGKITAMCGDGANDCGALKQADIGLSLSET